ncbi:hypothetical protein TELCIR_21256, partial [Teladorsagia circumcincta]
LSKCDKETELTGDGCMWKVVAAWIFYNCLLVGIAGSLEGPMIHSGAVVGAGISQVFFCDDLCFYGQFSSQLVQWAQWMVVMDRTG